MLQTEPDQIEQLQESHKFEITKLFLEHGYDPNQKVLSESGDILTVFGVMVQNGKGSLDYLKLFMTHGLDLNDYVDHGQTLLMLYLVWAVHYYIEIIYYLLDNGANIHQEIDLKAFQHPENVTFSRYFSHTSIFPKTAFELFLHVYEDAMISHERSLQHPSLDMVSFHHRPYRGRVIRVGNLLTAEYWLKEDGLNAINLVSRIGEGFQYQSSLTPDVSIYKVMEQLTPQQSLKPFLLRAKSLLEEIQRTEHPVRNGNQPDESRGLYLANEHRPLSTIDIKAQKWCILRIGKINLSLI